MKPEREPLDDPNRANKEAYRAHRETIYTTQGCARSGTLWLDRTNLFDRPGATLRHLSSTARVLGCSGSQANVSCEICRKPLSVGVRKNRTCDSSVQRLTINKTANVLQ